MQKKLLKNNEVGIFALGGLGEVGKNMYCIEYKDELIVIDSGILFPDDHLLGIDYVINDYTYLEENNDKIVGLFITHGHEDHIGGIPYLLKVVKIPNIYASGLAIGLINNKMQEHKGLNPNIIEFKEHYNYKFKNLEVSFFRTNHSIPDSFGIIIKTPQGVIVHTGDFKFDFTPTGPDANYQKIAETGKNKVLCLLSDSTNAELPTFTSSEQTVSSSIKELFRKINGRIIIATFASNTHRVQQIVEASVLTNRKIAIYGRSMEKTIDIGQKMGYIKAPKGTFIDSKNIRGIKESELTIICTGSQGEPLAALSRIANGSHRQIKLIPNDTVIFSSSPIPGNAISIGKTINLLFKNGANVITHSPLSDTHTSGHGGQEELKLMLKLIKPKYFMPIHGEYRMLKIHSNIAQKCGVDKDNLFVMENGHVLALTSRTARIAGKVQTQDVYIDGNGVGDIGNLVIRDRKLLSEDGLLSAIITINIDNNKLISKPTIVSRGFIYMKENEKLTREVQNIVEKKALDILNNSNKINIHLIKTEVTKVIKIHLDKALGRTPMIMPIIMTV